MKKVLVIGAGIGQLSLCQLIKQRGYVLILVTIIGDYPCISLADKVFYIDIFDKDKIVELAKREKIDAVVSDQNDLMMPTVAYVAEALNLPGNTLNQVISYCNKNLFRDYCDKLEIPSPIHFKINKIGSTKDIEYMSFPLVVKPEDSQSSIGVAKVSNINEYYAALRIALEKSKTHTAIVEEFFKGKEIVVEGFVLNGKYFNLGVADRHYFDIDNLFIPCQTIFPSIIPNAICEKVIQYETKFAEFVKPSFAIVHSEYLINEITGEIRIVESALRGGGVFISSNLIPLYTGIHIDKILLDCALGLLPNSLDFNPINRKSSAYICFYLKEGIIKSISGIQDIINFPFVDMCDVSLIIGQHTNKMTYKGQRLGPIIVFGEDRKDVESKIKTIQNTLQIRVLSYDGKDESGIVWE